MEGPFVGLITDSHDNQITLSKAVELLNRKGVDRVLHAGDYIAPFNARVLKQLRMPFEGVFGNNDGERFGLRAAFGDIGPIHRAPHEVVHAGRKILILHEPDALDALVASGVYDVIFYGHTHQIEVRPGATLVVNPGEACGWVTGRATIGILDLSAMKVEIVELKS
jgi:putative phosphoesterase